MTEWLTHCSLFAEVDRITASGYIPTRNDVVEVNSTRIPQHHEVMFKHGRGELRLFDPGLQCEMSPELLFQGHKSTAILFVVDLLSYHKYSVTAEGIRENMMMRSFNSLKSLLALISHSTFIYYRIAVMIVFTNTAAFEQHLMVEPLGNHFVLGHEGDARKYISTLFKSPGRTVVGVKTQVHFAQADDHESFRETWRFIHTSWNNWRMMFCIHGTIRGRSA